MEKDIVYGDVDLLDPDEFAPENCKVEVTLVVPFLTYLEYIKRAKAANMTKKEVMVFALEEYIKELA